MAFSEEWLNELLEKNDVVNVISSYVDLKPKGKRLWGLCPLHGEKTPSFSVSPEKQMFYCFSCKKGGSVINFIMEVENLSFPEAVQFLAKRANMPLPEEAETEEGSRRKRLLELNKDAARHFARYGQELRTRLRQGLVERSHRCHAEEGLHRSGSL